MAWLSMPRYGSSRRVHPTVVAMLGIMNDTQNMNSRPYDHFTLVRASVHAMSTATGNPIPV